MDGAGGHGERRLRQGRRHEEGHHAPSQRRVPRRGGGRGRFGLAVASSFLRGSGSSIGASPRPTSWQQVVQERIQPSMDVFKNMLCELDVGRKNPDGVCQGFLTGYFLDFLENPISLFFYILMCI
ncbi:serine/threonine-protein kinase fray2 isoform X1 [Iris pallida]|uniref:Serine/threonine-protein kinase fray2 isoform X1 n=1 Tax=Iris pallida TaxID=29817 RepID=A0AAX6GNU1_IRIPA|nr:serine/threonine-protein kinase fray2 isoform X1 [Iris pallida]